MNENSENNYAKLTPADRLILEALRMPPRDDSEDLPDEPEEGETWVVFIPKRLARPPEELPAAGDE